MSELFWHTTMSLDGYIAAPGDDMSWVFEVFEHSPLVQEVVDATGAIVMGRRTYEVEDRDRPGIYGGAWSGPLFVVTHDPPDVAPDWMSGEFVQGPMSEIVERAKAAAGEKNVGVLGADVARQCLEADILDEIIVHLAPVLLGDGVRFHETSGGDLIRLQRTLQAQSGQLTDLRFRVRH